MTRLVAAQARDLRRVRVSFDGAVRQASPGAADDALDPERYSIDRQSSPAVDVSVVVVEPVTSSSVDLLTDIELTAGALYRVTVTGVRDLLGNEVLPPGNAATFLGLVPARPATRRLDLYQLLPAMNRREDETGDLRRFLACLQEVTDLLLRDIDRFTDILDPDIAPEPFVDLMLQDLGNPFALDLSLVDKRRLLRVLVAIYREKGTAAGINNAIRFFLGIEVEIVAFADEALVLGESLLGVDWVLGPSDAFARYAFDIAVPRRLTTEELRRVRMLAEYMKPGHTHLASIVEPVVPEVIEHVELGLSELGATWELH